MTPTWTPWRRRRPDPDAAERARREAEHHARELAETLAVRRRFEAVLGHAELSKRRTEWVIKENHLAPKLAAALRKSQ